MSDRRALLIVLAFVAIHAVAVFLLPRITSPQDAVDWTWGFTQIAYFPLPAVIAWYLLALLVAWPAATARLHRIGAGAIGPIAALAERRPRLFTLAVAACALALFVLFDVKHVLLGDAFRRPNNIEAYLILRHELGAMHLLHWIYRGLNATLGLDGRATIELVSQACGVVFVVATLRLASALGRTRGEKVTIGLFYGLMGTVLLFFGYVESYAPAFAAVTLYLLAAIRYLDGRVTIVWPIVLVALSVLLHVAAVAFVPSLAVVVWLRSGRGMPSWRMIGLAALVAAPIAWGVVVWLEDAVRSAVLPLTPDPDFGSTLFSIVHLREYVNGQLMATGIGAVLAPVLLVVAWRRGRIDREIVFLAAASIVPALEMFLFDARLGRADWDIVAMPSLAVQLLAAVLIVRLAPRASLWRVAIPAVGLVALHTVPRIALNATDLAADRFVDILATDPGSYYLAQPGALIAARTLDDNGLVLRARRAAAIAYEQHADDPRCAYAYALLLARTGRTARAAEISGTILERFPRYLPAYGLLVTLDVDGGREDRLAATLARLFDLYREDPRHVRRAYSPGKLAEMFARLGALLDAGVTPPDAPAAEEVAAAVAALGGR